MFIQANQIKFFVHGQLMCCGDWFKFKNLKAWFEYLNMVSRDQKCAIYTE